MGNQLNSSNRINIQTICENKAPCQVDQSENKNENISNKILQRKYSDNYSEGLSEKIKKNEKNKIIFIAKKNIHSQHVQSKQQNQSNQNKKVYQGKIKRLNTQNIYQKNTKIKTDNQTKKNDDTMQEFKFKYRMLKCLVFFKSLQLLKYYQTVFQQTYPTIISNKDKQVISLRRQIMQQKQNHSFFSKKNRGQVQQIQNGLDFKEMIDRRKFCLFQVIQKIERSIIRIFQTGKHQKVLKQIIMLDKNIDTHTTLESISKIERFINGINSVNIQFLDMLFHQLSKQSIIPQQVKSRRTQGFTLKKISNVIDLKNLIMKESTHREIPSVLNKKQKLDYQFIKNIGLQIYRANKVCFYIMAGGMDSSFWEGIQKQENYICRELFPLNLPSNLSILYIIFERYDAFAELIEINELTLFILVNQAKSEGLNQFIIQNQSRWNHLNIVIMRQSQIPCLDLEGNLVLTQNNQKQKQVLKTSNGTGDLWDFLKESSNQLGIKYLLQNQFEYIQVIGTKNCLEQGFDCFLLGLAASQRLDWTTKVVEPISKSSQLKINQLNSYNQSFNHKVIQKYKQTFKQPIMYENQTNQITIIDHNQQKYSNTIEFLQKFNKEYYTFTNHSIFSVDFVNKKIFNESWKQQITYKKKVIQDENGKQNIVVFQKDLSDIFKKKVMNETGRLYKSQNLSQNEFQQDFKLLSDQRFSDQRYIICKYQRNEEYYPLVYKYNSGIYDVQGCSRILSSLYASLLNISIEKYMCSRVHQVNYLQKSSQQTSERQRFLKCYIDPHISLQGQNLEQIKLDIQKRLNQFLVSQRTFNSTDDYFRNNQNTALTYIDNYQNTKNQQINDGYNILKRCRQDQHVSKIVSSLSQISIFRQIQTQQQQENIQKGQNNDKYKQKINIIIN